VEQQQYEGSVKEREGVTTMIAKPEQKVVVCTVALAIVIATGWAVEDTLVVAHT